MTDVRSAALPGSDTWIVSTSLDKPDEQTRRFIRSHVMRGKNTRVCRRSRRMVGPKAYDRQDKPVERPGPAGDKAWVVTTPHRVASEIELFGLDIELRPYMLDLIHRAFTFMKPSHFLVETTLIGHRQRDFFCFSIMNQTSAMVHAMLFQAQAFNDVLQQAPYMYSHVARYHLSKALEILQKRLNDEKTATEVSTMIIVTSLATAGIFLGDMESSRKHMDGLYQMVTLAGGLEALGHGTMVEHKAQRIDFGLALADGTKVRFFRDDISWSPHPGLSSGKKSYRFPELSAVQPRPDPRLLNIWADLQGFAAAANQATSFGMKMPSSLFIDVTSSAPYRLTHLELDQGSLAELLRLCMLAFLKTILTNIVGLGRHLTYLAGGLKGALLAQRHVHEPELNELLFWALFLTALAVFEDHDRDWIREMLEEEAAALGLRTWGDAGAVLKRYLWVDLVFEDTGEQLFNEWLGSQELPIDGSCETGSVGWS